LPDHFSFVCDAVNAFEDKASAFIVSSV